MRWKAAHQLKHEKKNTPESGERRTGTDVSRRTVLNPFWGSSLLFPNPSFVFPEPEAPAVGTPPARPFGSFQGARIGALWKWREMNEGSYYSEMTIIHMRQLRFLGQCSMSYVVFCLAHQIYRNWVTLFFSLGTKEHCRSPWGIELDSSCRRRFRLREWSVQRQSR